MLCVAASTGPGYDVLDVNWQVANDVAAEHGHVMDRSALRLVAPGHVAETRDQAIAEITDGFHRWDSHMRDVIEGGGEILGLGSMEQLLEGGAIVGSIDDAVESLESYWEKSGGFGAILYQLTPWASEEDQRRSLKRFAEEVMPRFTGRSRLRHASHERSARNKDELSARARPAPRRRSSSTSSRLHRVREPLERRQLERQADVVLGQRGRAGGRARDVVELGLLHAQLERVVARVAVQRARHPPGEALRLPGARAGRCRCSGRGSPSSRCGTSVSPRVSTRTSATARFMPFAPVGGTMCAASPAR